MAKPRIFVSSTYYDLKNLRSDIERFINGQGYEPILNEDGKMPYIKEEKLEEACYREVQRCDILISIIGGRRGTNSSDTDYSITNKELKIAVEHGRQVYIFIESAVFNEYKTYLNNKDNESVKYAAVDDRRIYKFIEELESLPLNNVMQPFNTATDIIIFLKEQWAGLFQRLLESNVRQKEIDTISNLNNISNTLQQLVTYIKQKNDNNDAAIKDIILCNHPAFQQLRKSLDIPFRVIFNTYAELKSLLSALSYEEKAEFHFLNEEIIWIKKTDTHSITLTIKNNIFDDNGNLKPYTAGDWQNVWISMLSEENRSYDDEIPF